MTDVAKMKVELWKVKVENFQLKRVLMDQVERQLADEQRQIEAECLEGAEKGSTFDWQTATVVPPAQTQE